MSIHHHAPPAHMSDRELIARVRELAIVESYATADLVAHLAELDERHLYREEGCPSLFAYCVEVLHLSEHAAYNRIEAARATRRFPLVLERLKEGAVHLTAVRLLRPHLTGENHKSLLDAARHRSRRQVEELIAHLNPKPDVPATVRKLPERMPVDAPGRLFEASPSAIAASTCPSQSRPIVPAAAPAPRPVVAPLAPERYRIQFTASASARDMLRRAQEILRHRVPDGDPAVIFEMALALLIKELERRKLAATERPLRNERAHAANGRKTGAADSSTRHCATRHLPASVKRAVRLRDEDRCAFVSPNGRRCSARGWLEFHHIEPYARGGPATLENVSLHCRAHNRHEAELHFRPKEHRQPISGSRVPEKTGGGTRPETSQPRLNGRQPSLYGGLDLLPSRQIAPRRPQRDMCRSPVGVEGRLS